jgi:hypothetical protein
MKVLLLELNLERLVQLLAMTMDEKKELGMVWKTD